MRVLVTGRPSYIGSVVVEELGAAGAERIVVVDDLSIGHHRAVPHGVALLRGDVGDVRRMTWICRDAGLDAAIHLAASSIVGESVRNPARHYANNVTTSLSLLEALRGAGVARLVFSSTAAVYGEPTSTPINEDAPDRADEPYGETKLVVERTLRWYDEAYGIRFVSLRYFNAAGATLLNGEDHDPETHLIPAVLDVARGLRPEVDLFGEDYPPPMGRACAITCTSRTSRVPTFRRSMDSRS
jgi:UDP-glucose 4-epimerase